jgi:SAM-dependent methyltransferase
MDERTCHFYCRNAVDLFHRYNRAQEGVSVYFKDAFLHGSSVLDIGCGSGRDVLRLIHQGYHAYGIDPCAGFIDLAIAENPELSGRLFRGDLPFNLGNLPHTKFDGILCSAVLMHIPDEDLFDSVYSIQKLLKDNGRLLISLPTHGESADVSDDSHGDRDSDGRLMILRNPWDMQLLLERTGFELKDYWESADSLGREGITWTTMLFYFREAQTLRPIDKIEGILNRDKKDATYKLALFRALCDIALTGFRRVKMLKGHKIGILLEDIVDKWLVYYWPLVENAVPQKFGEYPDFNRKMAFRTSMETLTRHYSANGGLQGFILDRRSKRLTPEAEKYFKKAADDIGTTIKKGPVVYAGGSLQTGTVFGYDGETGRVLLSPELWREFVLMGHWIRDALILRWAELTSRISRGSKRPSEIIDLLLREPIPERETGDARDIYKTIEEKECVWTGKLLKAQFEVDHAIPYSLWMSNDLWNLFPIDSVVNNRKRDKLPTSVLVKRRKSFIVDYWKLLRGHRPERFDYEMERFTGLERFEPGNWENRLFSFFLEAIEYTAIQRGIDRWEP